MEDPTTLQKWFHNRKAFPYGIQLYRLHGTYRWRQAQRRHRSLATSYNRMMLDTQFKDTPMLYHYGD